MFLRRFFLRSRCRVGSTRRDLMPQWLGSALKWSPRGEVRGRVRRRCTPRGCLATLWKTCWCVSSTSLHCSRSTRCDASSALDAARRRTGDVHRRHSGVPHRLRRAGRKVSAQVHLQGSRPCACKVRDERRGSGLTVRQVSPASRRVLKRLACCDMALPRRRQSRTRAAPRCAG